LFLSIRLGQTSSFRYITWDIGDGLNVGLVFIFLGDVQVLELHVVDVPGDQGSGVRVIHDAVHVDLVGDGEVSDPLFERTGDDDRSRFLCLRNLKFKIELSLRVSNSGKTQMLKNS